MKIEGKNQQKYIEEGKKWSIVILTGFSEKVQLNLKAWNKMVLDDFRVQKWHKNKLENLKDF
jgi:hypothetical protein